MALGVIMATWSWLAVVFEAVAVGGEDFFLRTEAAMGASGLFIFFCRAQLFSSIESFEGGGWSSLWAMPILVP